MKNLRALSLVLFIPLAMPEESIKQPIKSPIYLTENHKHEDELYIAFEKYFGDINPKDFKNIDDYWFALLKRIQKLKKDGVLEKKDDESYSYPAMKVFGYLIVITILTASGVYIIR